MRFDKLSRNRKVVVKNMQEYQHTYFRYKLAIWVNTLTKAIICRSCLQQVLSAWSLKQSNSKALTQLTETKLSTGHICISCVPTVITHCAPSIVVTNLHTTFKIACSANKPDVSIGAGYWHICVQRWQRRVCNLATDRHSELSKQSNKHPEENIQSSA